MRAVGIKALKNKLSEYVRVAADGETILVTHRDRVVAELGPVLARALEPFPAPVRTLDALNLASAEFLRERQPAIRLATYDTRQAAAATAMGIVLYDFDAGE